MRRAFVVVALLAGVPAVATWMLAPPSARRLSLGAGPPMARGALHVHTTRSDGAGTPDQVAAAAAEAGLDFVVLTDHGDATRPPAPPRYASGVLLVDGVELSTTGGHYLALGLPASPYPLAGEPRDVIQDVSRLGGFGIAAHPDSPKGELSWREWQAPFDGLEWLNADSAWRDEPRGEIARALAGYWWRAPETIASLFDRPATTIARWDALSRRRRVIAVAGHDAHARLGARGEWDGEVERYSLRLPSYASAFRTFSVGVQLQAPLDPTDAQSSASVVFDAIRRGRVFTVIDALAGPARLEFSAVHAGGVAEAGDEVPPGVRAEVRAGVPDAPHGLTLVIVRDGQQAAKSRGTGHVVLSHEPGDPPAVYRAEARLDGAPGDPPVPWIVGNGIRVGFPGPVAVPPLLPAAAWSRALPQAGWLVEKHPSSTTELAATVLAPDNTGWTLSWRLGGGAPAGQYAAMAVPLSAGALRGADRLSFTARGEGPMRVSVQLRSHARGGARWRRSVYLSATPSPIAVPLGEMTPVDEPPSALDPAAIDSVLFVVDTVNTAPGSGGELWVSALRAEGAQQAARQVRTVSSR